MVADVKGWKLNRSPFLLLPFQSKCKGQDLFDQIMYHIDLVETDYFGLQFMDTEQVSVSKTQDTYFYPTDLKLMFIYPF